MKLYGLNLIVCFSFIVLLTNCKQIKEKSEDPEMIKVNPLERPDNPFPGINDFDDLPIPRDSEITHSPLRYVRGDIRVLCFNYKLQKVTDIDYAINFFTKNMPKFGWNQISADFKPYEALLMFTKGNEKCAIQIEKMENDIFFTIAVNYDFVKK